MAVNYVKAMWAHLTGKQPITGSVLDSRLNAYETWEKYYHNSIYLALSDGGLREQINATLGNAEAADLAGLYNPVALAVNLYQHVFGGEFGVDILAETDNDAIIDPLRQVWRWSNINEKKQVLCQYAPTYGNVGLRVVVKYAERVNDRLIELPLDRRRVYIKPEHPRVIRDVELDERGNVEAIELEYDLVEGIGDAQVVTKIREYQDKEWFQWWTVRPGGILTDHQYYRNELGVVPYVLLAHMPCGDKWGLNAFYRASVPIDRINALMTHIATQIHLHVNATLAVAYAGNPPAEYDLSGRKVAHFNTLGGQQPPVFEWLVADLSLADAIAQVKEMQQSVEDDLPELKAVMGRFMANQSGELIEKLRQPAQDRLALARSNYEDALIRAQQLALSLGVLYEMFDIGTGTGTREAAERAYQGGFEDHRFNSRELLPLTELEKAQLAQERQAAGVTKNKTLPDLGYSKEAVQEMEVERESERIAAGAAFGAAFDRGAL